MRPECLVKAKRSGRRITINEERKGLARVFSSPLFSREEESTYGVYDPEEEWVRGRAGKRKEVEREI